MKRLKELWKNIQVNDDNADDKPIRLLKPRRELIDDIVKDAAPLFRAGPAGNTTADIPVADLYHLGFNVLFSKNPDELLKSDRRIPLHAGTSV